MRIYYLSQVQTYLKLRKFSFTLWTLFIPDSREDISVSKLATIDESALFEGQVTQVAIGAIKSGLYFISFHPGN